MLIRDFLENTLRTVVTDLVWLENFDLVDYFNKT